MSGVGAGPVPLQACRMIISLLLETLHCGLSAWGRPLIFEWAPNSWPWALPLPADPESLTGVTMLTRAAEACAAIESEGADELSRLEEDSVQSDSEG